jgi:DNA-binding transcriptional LysR family regulator
VHRERERKQLKIVLEDFEPAPLPVSIVFPQARLLPARVRVFVDFAAAELRRALAELA